MVGAARSQIAAVIFDMDGVVTDTASVHAAAWKRLFDQFLEERSRRTGQALRPFDVDADYRRYVDGKPRYDGVRDFLRARGITLPEGAGHETPEAETVRGLGNRKDGYFNESIRADGVRPYPGTVRLVEALQAAGVGVAIISASRNLNQVLESAGLAELFAVRVDGVEAQRLNLKGKPEPDVFLEAARRLGVDPARTAIVEDALAGVEAGGRGGFALVVGVDRTGHAEELRARGADVVVRDPGELLDDGHLRIGIARQREAIARAVGGSPEPVTDDAWLLEVDGWDPLREGAVEAWMTVANGRTGTRGSLEEGSEESLPATYVAGVFGADAGSREPVVGPEWTHLFPRVDHEPLDLDRGEVLEHRRVLDLRQGMVFRYWRQRMPSGVEVRFRSVRFASLAERALLVLDAEASSDGPAVDLAGGIPLPPSGGPLERVEVRSEDDRVTIELRARDGGAAAFSVATEEEPGSVRRLVTVSRAGDGAATRADTDAILGDADATLTRARQEGIDSIAERHRAAWRSRWDDADVVVEGDPEAQRALRFGLYHLVSSADPESDLASVGARGLSGAGYRGHVFWDNEVFVLPFFIHTHPPTARALLEYRHRTLPAARARAAALGYRGALFAWESADTGEDVTPAKVWNRDGTPIPILTAAQEHHIVADVAWAVWRYWQATGDDAFGYEMGAEILLETARFWASRARRGRDGRYHIARVIGPDEYHETVRDNAFTNVLARWNLERGLETAALLREAEPERWSRLSRRIGLRAGELRRWRAVADGLVDGFDPSTGVYEQFDGFFGLEDVRAADLAARPFPGDFLLGRPRVQRTQLVKQADVVMLLHMLPDLVPAPVVAANYRYYEPRTSHGSSLSPAIHAAVAARLGLMDDALFYLRIAAAVDLGDAMGNAALGVHVATMGGLWQAAVMGFGGVTPDGHGLRLDPRLPADWLRLSFPFAWRGATVRLDVRRDSVEVDLDRATEISLGTAPPRRLAPGRHRARRAAEGWSPLESGA